MKNLFKTHFSRNSNAIFLYCFLLKFFAIEGMIPPSKCVWGTQHALIHPEDVKYEKYVKPFTFLDYPLKGSSYNVGSYIFSWPMKYVFTIPEGRCCYTTNPTVITQDNFVLSDASYEYGLLSPEFLSILSRPILQTPEFIDGTVAVLASHGSQNYYHWMIDVIPKLGLIEQANIKPDYFYFFSTGKSFEKETLSILGIDETKIINAKKNKHIQAKTLIVPSMLSLPETQLFTNIASPLWSFEFLRKKFLNEEVSYQSLRIYVTREKACWRKVVNDVEVSNFLAGFGFIRVKLEEMSVVDQAKLFASAEIIIAPHGAGLTNLVFCSPGTKVIELMPFSGPECNECAPYFWCMSQQLQLFHQFLICENENLSDPEIQRKHLFVDICKLHQIIIDIL